MAERFKFTKTAIEALPAPSKRARYYDTRTPGLTLRVTPNGGKVFYFYKKVDGRPLDIKIGAFPVMTVEVAQQKCMELAVAAHGGEAPVRAARRPRGGQTFDELFRWWLETYARRRNKTADIDEQRYNKYLAELGRRQANLITRNDIRQLHARIGHDHGKVLANRLLALVSTVYKRAIVNEVFNGPNPAVGVEPFRELSRDRRLMAGEVPAFFRALESERNPDVRDFVYLALFTGQRKSNILAMRWEEVDLTSGVWRIPMTKNGRPHSVPLLEDEAAILTRRKQENPEGCPWVFPARRADSTRGHLVSIKRGWKHLLDRAEISNLRLHDLRRTLASWMADTGSATSIIGKTLGHLSPTATAVYERLSLNPVREAKGRAIGAMMDSKKGPEVG